MNKIMLSVSRRKRNRFLSSPSHPALLPLSSNVLYVDRPLQLCMDLWFADQFRKQGTKMPELAVFSP